jgi:hypothetical protein
MRKIPVTLMMNFFPTEEVKKLPIDNVFYVLIFIKLQDDKE